MTLHKLHAGDGYTYLTRQVPAGDEGRFPGQQLADYYTASGNPPGRWVGAGAADLEIEGRVREDQMRALFGRGLHPDADQIVALELARSASRRMPLGRRSSAAPSRCTPHWRRPPNAGDERPVRRSTGENVLVEHGSARFTTQELLAAEQRLLGYAHQPTRHGVAPHRLLELMGSFERRYGVTLDRGQRALVLGFAADPRRLVVGIGPAGAGKTTAMRAVAEAWRTTGRRVEPIAPSATAAEVLGAELCCRAENLHKFRHAHTCGSEAHLDPWFRLEPGDLVLIDEAGLARTRNLDWLTHYARERGGIVRLLGDPAQLGSVEAGGALRLLAHQTGAVELTDLHGFSNPNEAAATIGLREGDHTALDFYLTRDRVSSGSTDAMREAAYDAWAADTARGLTSLLITSTSKDAQALNHRARLDRIATGQVAATGTELHDGTIASVGDRIVTRKKQRQLTNRDGTTFVKNGDTWTVEQRSPSGTTPDMDRLTSPCLGTVPKGDCCGAGSATRYRAAPPGGMAFRSPEVCWR